MKKFIKNTIRFITRFNLLSSILFYIFKAIVFFYHINERFFSICIRGQKYFENCIAEKETGKIEVRIKNKMQCGKKIKAAFLVFEAIGDSLLCLYNIILNHYFDFFELSIIVIPTTDHSTRVMLTKIENSCSLLKNAYENVYSSWDYDKKKFIEFNDFDIIFTSNPYDSYTHRYYTIDYLKNKSLIVFICYGYVVSSWYARIINQYKLNFVWKIFTDNKYSAQLYNSIKGEKDILLFGASKMDKMVEVNKENRKRKLIIIAPHHTIFETEGFVNLSNFLKYSELYIKLPDLYPEIDFVFRPHPELKYKLFKLWGQESTEAYWEKLKSKKNLVINENIGYFDIFVNSDAIIHDCGSFMMEYLFTGHPACYLVNNHTRKNLTDFANRCIDTYYNAFCENDILEFIDDVVIGGNDPLKLSREQFFNEELKFNYPNTSIRILDYIINTVQART